MDTSAGYGNRDAGGAVERATKGFGPSAFFAASTLATPDLYVIASDASFEAELRIGRRAASD